MRKFFFLVVLVAALLDLSSGKVLAQQTLAPGCNPEIWNMQKNYSQAVRARDDAVHSEGTKQNDSTLGLTCFDQQMAATARIGTVFSDNNPPPPIIGKRRVSYPTWGAEKTLVLDLNRVINPILTRSLDNFDDSVTKVLQPVENALETLNQAIQGDIDDIVQTQTASFGECSIVGTLMAQLGNLIEGLGYAPPTFIQAALSAIQTVQGYIADAEESIRERFQTPIYELTASVQVKLGGGVWVPTTNTPGTGQGSAGGEIGICGVPMITVPDGVIPGIPGVPGGSQGQDCNNLERLWSDPRPPDPNAPVDSAQGQGINLGIPYTSMNIFVQTGASPGGRDYNGSRNANRGVLDNAMNDMTTLARPGGIDSWPASPNFPWNASTAQIINGM